MPSLDRRPSVHSKRLVGSGRVADRAALIDALTLTVAAWNAADVTYADQTAEGVLRSGRSSPNEC